MCLIWLINRVDEVVGGYGKHPRIFSIRALARQAMWVMSVLAEINERLPLCREDLENGVIKEPFPCNFWKNNKARRLKGSAMEQDLLKHGDETLESLGMSFSINNQDIVSIKDFTIAIEAGYQEMDTHLEAIHELLSTIPLEAYEHFYQNKKSEYEETSARNMYKHWKFSHTPLTLESLKAKQAEVVALALMAGIMDYDEKPKTYETLRVDLEKVKLYLSEETIKKLPDDFDLPCAKFRRYISWGDDYIIRVDYKKFGQYICRHFDKLRVEQLVVLFELDMMLYLIHQDMVKLKSELSEFLPIPVIGSLEGTKYFAPYKFIATMLQDEWFKGLRTDEKYGFDWAERFADGLERSEHGSLIADSWKKNNWKIMGYVLGCLKMAGVINNKVSNDNIARSAAIVDNWRSFGKCIGKESQEQPYSEWIINNVDRYC